VAAPFLHHCIIGITAFAVSTMLSSCGGEALTPPTTHSHSSSGQAKLAWDPPDISTDVAGFMIHYGTAPGYYSQDVVVGNATTHTVSNLINGQTYYFTVTAYNTVGYQSIYSNEVSILIAP